MPTLRQDGTSVAPVASRLQSTSPLQNALPNIAQWLEVGSYFSSPFGVSSLGPGFRTTHLRIVELIQRQVCRPISRQLAIAPRAMHAGYCGELRQMIDVVPLVKIVLDLWSNVQTYRQEVGRMLRTSLTAREDALVHSACLDLHIGENTFIPVARVLA